MKTLDTVSLAHVTGGATTAARPGTWNQNQWPTNSTKPTWNPGSAGTWTGAWNWSASAK